MFSIIWCLLGAGGHCMVMPIRPRPLAYEYPAAWSPPQQGYSPTVTPKPKVG